MQLTRGCGPLAHLCTILVTVHCFTLSDLIQTLMTLLGVSVTLFTWQLQKFFRWTELKAYLSRLLFQKLLFYCCKKNIILSVCHSYLFKTNMVKIYKESLTTYLLSTSHSSFHLDKDTLKHEHNIQKEGDWVKAFRRKGAIGISHSLQGGLRREFSSDDY